MKDAEKEKMNNEVYGKVTATIDDLNKLQQGDGDSADFVCLTKENNGFALFHSTFDGGTRLVKWFKEHEKNDALEFAVDYSRKQISLIKQMLGGAKK